MTDSYGSTAEKTIFDWDEIPWLYLRLPKRGPNVTLALWKDPENNRYLTGSIGHNQEVWLTLGDRLV